MKVATLYETTHTNKKFVLVFKKYEKENEVSYEQFFNKNYDLDTLYEQEITTLRDFLIRDYLKLHLFNEEVYNKILELPTLKNVSDNEKIELLSSLNTQLDLSMDLFTTFNDYVAFWDKVLINNNLIEVDFTEFFEKLFPEERSFYGFNVAGDELYKFVYKIIAYDKNKVLNLDVLPNKDDLVISRGIIFGNHVSQYHRWLDLNLYVSTMVNNKDVYNGLKGIEYLLFKFLYLWDLNNVRYLKRELYKKVIIGLGKEEILSLIKYHTDVAELVDFDEIINYYENNTNSGLLLKFNIKNPIIPMIVKFSDTPIYIIKKILKIMESLAKILGRKSS